MEEKKRERGKTKRGVYSLLPPPLFAAERPLLFPSLFSPPENRKKRDKKVPFLLFSFLFVDIGNIKQTR